MTLNSGSSWLSFLKYRLQARVTTSGFVCSFLFCGFLFWLCFYFHCKIGVEPRALCVLGKHSPKPQPSLGLWLSVCEHHHRSSEQTRASAGEEGRTEGRGRKERKKEEFHAPLKKGTYARCLDAGRFSCLTEPFSCLRLAFRDWKTARAHQCTV